MRYISQKCPQYCSSSNSDPSGTGPFPPFEVPCSTQAFSQTRLVAVHNKIPPLVCLVIVLSECILTLFALGLVIWMLLLVILLLIIMCIYHALINALSAHMIHINLNDILSTHRTQFHPNNPHKAPYRKTHTPTTTPT